MNDKKLFMRVIQDDFLAYKRVYERVNYGCEKTFLYHVGVGAGLYSELGGMLEAVAYCYENKIAFKMYADDANFCEGGWEDFFEPFCELSHNKLNKIANYRYRAYFRQGGVVLPNLLLRRIVFPKILKVQERVDYLYQDLFSTITSDNFHNSDIEYPLFHMKGILHDEYARMASLCLRYNEETAHEILQLIASVNLPDKYTSIQIRGGDKLLELQDIKSEEFFLKILERKCSSEKNFFVFSDDYRKIEYLRKQRPDWNIYTLTRESEKGYYNAQFNKLTGEQKRKDVIKVFAMVEICILAETHIGCKQTCVNNYIRSAKKVNGTKYFEYDLGIPCPANLNNRLSHIIIR